MLLQRVSKILQPFVIFEKAAVNQCYRQSLFLLLPGQTTSFAKWCKEVTRIPRHFHHLIHLDTKRTQQRRMLPFLLYIFFMFNVNVTLYEYIIIFIRSFLRQVFPMILPFMYHEVLHCYNFPCVCDPFSAVCRKISHYSQVCYEKIFQQ